MVNKFQIKKILFIRRYVIKQRQFTAELFKKLGDLLNDKISAREFDLWLETWYAAAELDQNPKTAEKIKKAFREIKTNKTPHKSWKGFMDSLGPQ
jgi:hypothetical protein